MRVLDCITCMETWCKEQRCWIYERKWIHLQAVQKITLFLHLARKIVNPTINKKSELSEADLGLLQAVNYYHKSLLLGYCRGPRSTSDIISFFALIVLPSPLSLFFSRYISISFKLMAGACQMRFRQPLVVFFKKVVLINFAKFKGKH